MCAARNAQTGDSVAIKKVSWAAASSVGPAGMNGLTSSIRSQRAGHEDFLQEDIDKARTAGTEVRLIRSGEALVRKHPLNHLSLRLLSHFRGHKNVRCSQRHQGCPCNANATFDPLDYLPLRSVRLPFTLAIRGHRPDCTFAGPASDIIDPHNFNEV